MRCFLYITGTSDKGLKRWDLLCTVMMLRQWYPFSSTCQQKLCKSVLLPKMYANRVVALQRYDWLLKTRKNSKTSNYQSETWHGFLWRHRYGIFRVQIQRMWLNGISYNSGLSYTGSNSWSNKKLDIHVLSQEMFELSHSKVFNVLLQSLFSWNVEKKRSCSDRGIPGHFTDRGESKNLSFSFTHQGNAG